jgi:uncharacterized Fe-S cluster-containing protein
MTTIQTGAQAAAQAGAQVLASGNLPGHNCGVCGYRTCNALAEQLDSRPDLIKRCINLSENRVGVVPGPASPTPAETGANQSRPEAPRPAIGNAPTWRDTLGREFDFYLEHFPEDPGPREIILPHNPMLTREMEIVVGDLIIGRPLGMSCGCPITHCGVVSEVDPRTGVIVWCVTGPLGPREKGFKDIGYYIAEGYEGLITDSRTEIKIGT